MFLGGGFLSVVLLLFWMWAIFDVIVTPEGTQRHLPKLAWVIIVVVLWVFGAMAWTVAGRPRGAPVGLTGRVGGHPSEARDEASRMSDRERAEIERREYYRRMDEELDRRLEEKRREEGNDSA